VQGGGNALPSRGEGQWRLGASLNDERGHQQLDLGLAVTTAALVITGLVMVLSASQVISLDQGHSAYYLFARQAVFAVLGLVALVLLSRVDYHRLRRMAPLAAAVALALMVLALAPRIGLSSNGAQRWINLGPLGTLEPSEVAKLAFALYLAHWIAKRGDRVRSFADSFIPILVILIVVLGLMTLQKDLGTALVLTSIFVAVYFTGGGPKSHVTLLSLLLVAAFVGLIVIESYRLDRLQAFVNPFKDPQGKTLQPYQALVGLGSGGLTGVGLGHSVQKYDWLPQAHTDFIFAIVGEETGLIGATLLMAGFVIFAVRGYRAAMRAPDRLGVMIATGITTWITFQALVNMGVVTNTLPTTGVPLPFISYGGSALAVSMAAVGVLLNVSSQGVNQPLFSDRRIDATVDSGRRHRRTPIAGTRSRAGIPR
jgi:cell division protein FtsW